MANPDVTISVSSRHPQNTPYRVVLYCDSMLDCGRTAQDQFCALRRVLESRGFVIVSEISEAKHGNPEWNRLLAAGKAGQFDAIAYWTVGSTTPSIPPGPMMRLHQIRPIHKAAA